ncbi:DUF4270 domain-containing protein [Hymenobacter weizhouensis]|uniref:DUF4270 domain-containing protein n=1 Tax=Hymenobacter sp. YIM 151500-1 TaxID=2987689 RepID=UPI002226E721|nr:DUF4270 domain-containing protein [Hymenobacter sp. YIM 151500-1]UYZ62197.1 DUF4270 domain-containing protein [Hymenobacter sp. YIM 151500-1]
MLLGVASSCEEANDVGLDLPGTAPINAEFLEFPVAASTIRLSPVQTGQANQVLVGRLRDNQVGLTTARAFLNAQVVMPLDSLPAKFTAVKLDSVVLSFGFSQGYGNTAQPLRFDLLQLQQPLDERAVYNSTSSVATGNAVLTNFVASLNRTRKVRRRLNASSTTDTTTTVVTEPDRTIKIRPLKQASAAGLATTLFAALQDPGFNQERLNSVLKGLALVPTAGFDDNIVAFDRSVNTYLRFYFTGTNSAGKVSTRRGYDVLFGITQSNLTRGTKYFTQLNTDFTGTPFAALSSTSQQVGPSAVGGYTFVQNGVGLSTRLEFRGLDALRTTPGLTINRAELLIPIRQYTNALFPYPSSLYVYELNASNQVLQRTINGTTYDRLVQADLDSVSGAPVNPTGTGVPAAATFPRGSEPQFYRLTMTNYLQAYLSDRLNGELPAALALSPLRQDDLTLNLNRAQVDAAAIKLRVYYTKLR